jgi:hypothetical protein
MINIKDTILAQYANSPTITALIQNFNDAVDPLQDLNSFYNSIWDITTATGYGLDVWGKIVGISRSIPLPLAPATCGIAVCGVSVCGDTTTIAQRSTNLDDAEYRNLILIKAFGNISPATIPSINNQLRTYAAGRGPAWVHDVGNMRMSYYCDFPLTPVDVAIFKKTNAFLKPSGVNANVVYNPNTLAVCGLAICGLTICGT